uniref:Uncharacterized protein n=1 Tax=Anguilla anguilla TaxID=7936 RepID=A0A0E9QQS6_ANGAN
MIRTAFVLCAHRRKDTFSHMFFKKNSVYLAFCWFINHSDVKTINGPKLYSAD